jgi:hypothetical protein
MPKYFPTVWDPIDSTLYLQSHQSISPLWDYHLNMHITRLETATLHSAAQGVPRGYWVQHWYITIIWYYLLATVLIGPMSIWIHKHLKRKITIGLLIWSYIIGGCKFQGCWLTGRASHSTHEVDTPDQPYVQVSKLCSFLCLHMNCKIVKGLATPQMMMVMMMMMMNTSCMTGNHTLKPDI